MRTRPLAAALLLAVPASSLLVACDRKAEDTSSRQRIEQRALERDLDLALRPDTPRPAVQLNDVPVTADAAQPEVPAFTPPPPAPEPRREPPPPPARKPEARPRPQPREPEPERAPVYEAPAAPAAPVYVTRTAVAGQSFTVSFDRQVSAKADGVGSTFTATLTDALVDDLGRTVIPAGATVTGRITDVGRGRMGLAFTSVSYGGEHHPIDATVVSGPMTRQVNLDSRGERVAKVAAPAAAGAVLGRVLGRSRRSAAIGAVIGAAAGAAAAGATADIDTVVDPGATATIRLDGPIVIRRRAGE
ncbi:MAG TPA: hypothetical protein VGO40_15705 [Longimicrobium sp.]|jgi:hypothetical protein|nr:hypothetical protein [Longimicrobium sp.]